MRTTTRSMQDIKKVLTLVLAFLGLAMQGHAQTYAKTASRNFPYSSLASTQQLYVRAYPTTFCFTGGASQTIRRATLNGRFDFGADYNYGSNTGISASVTVAVTGYNSYSSNTNPLFTDSRVLNISSSAPEQLFSMDFTAFHPQANRIEVTATYGTVPSNLQSVVRLQVSYDEDFAFDVRSILPYVTVNALTSPVSSNPVTLSWNSPCISSPNYQLQLLRLYNTDPAKTSTEKNITARIDWNRALTIETGNGTTNLPLTIAEGTGFYVWRIRPIGNAYAGGIANDMNWGTWSDVDGFTQDTTVTVDSTMTSVPFLFFYKQFNDTLNWVYGRTFVEGDASGQVAIGENITYANGLMQGKQSQAHLQEENKVIVSQTVTDLSGRPSLSTLGAPVTQDFFQYVQGYAKDAAGGLYTAEDYDDDSNYLNPSIMDSTSYVSNYYSDNNTDLTIPGVNGLPFSRVRYYRDGTNRPRESSSPGQTHKLGSGHTTRVAYSSVADIEVVRVLGDEAPASNSVHKVIQTDANNTSSISYISKEGQTIATCLSYNPYDTLLDALPNTPPAGFTVLDTLKDNMQFDQYGITSTKPITFTEPTALTLYYDITSAFYGDSCNNICKACDYNITFYVHNVDDPALTWKQNVVIEPDSILGCTPGQRVVPSVTTSLLPAGDYVVERRIESYNTNSVTDSKYIDEQDSLLELTLYNQYTTGIAYVIDTALTVHMDTINAFLERSSLDSLYDYIGATSTDTMQYLVMGCDTLGIPIQRCEKYDCSDNTPDYESYLLNRWSSEFGSTLSTYLPGYTTGQFNAMITNMLTDTVVDTPYDCQQLWTCWAASVQAYKVLSEQGTATGHTFSLLDHFLSCAGKQYRGFTTTAHGSPGYLSHAYAYFNYTSASNSPCEHALCGGSNCTTTQFNAFTQSDWENLYNCIHSVQSTSPTNTDILTQANAIQDSCTSICQSRYTSFVSSLVALYEADGHAVQGYIFPDTITPVDTIPLMQVYCQAQNLVNNCASSCSLTIYYNSLDTTKIDSIGSQAETAAMTKAMTSPYQLSFTSGGSCPEGFNSVSGSVQTTDLYANYLNYRLALLRDSAGIYGTYWNYLQALTAFDSTLASATWHSAASATPYVYVHPDVPSRFEGGYSYMITDSIVTSQYKLERTYPAQSVGGRTFTVTDKLTMKQALSSGTAAFTDAFIDTSSFTLVPNSGSMSFSQSGPISAGTVFTRSYDVYLPGSSPGNVQFVNTTINITGLSQDTMTSSITLPRCQSLFYVFSSPSQPIASQGTITAGTNGFGYSSSASKTISNIYSRDSISNKTTYITKGTFAVSKSTATLDSGFVSIGHAMILHPSWTASTSLTDYNNASWSVKLFDSFCGTTSDCNAVCLKWTEMEFPDSLPELTQLTCEEQTSGYLMNYLATQQGAIIDKHRQQLRDDYFNKCSTSAGLLDHFSIGYTLNYYHYTLYYYDRAGNLVKTVPPDSVITTMTDRMSHPNHGFITEYAFNSLHQVKRQKSPDGGETKFWYDAKGKLRFSQNAKQQLLNAYSYTIYDALARPVEVGELVSLDTLQINTLTYPSTGNERQRTITYYTTPAAGITYFGNEPQCYLQNRVSYTCMDKDGNLATANDQTFSYYSYDPHGNVEWLVQDQPEIGKSYIAYEYDMVSGSVLKVKYNEELPGKFFHRYTYDADKRIKTAETSTDGMLWDKDDTYEYYAHGPLKRRNIGEDKVQGLDFIYTIQGWLKSINHPGLLASMDPGNDSDPSGAHSNTAADVYGMTLGYYENDFNRNNITTGASAFNSNSSNGYHLAGTPLYNGNISSWTNNIGKVTSGNRYDCLTGNKYRYDKLNRITKADFWQAAFGGWTNTNEYDEKFQYDANGNIVSMIRNGNSSVAMAMDTLVYHYMTNTNKLTYVDDAVSSGNYAVDIDDQSTGNYDYDAIGNLIQDNQEGITKIAWNPYGKIDTVYKSSGEKLVFLYDPSGNRIRKEVIASTTDPTLNSTTYYVRDASGNVMAVYKRTNTSLGSGNYTASYTLEEEPIYGSSRIGERIDNSIVVHTAGFTLSTPPTTASISAENRSGWESMQLPVQNYVHVGSVNVPSQSLRSLNGATAGSSAAVTTGVQGRNTSSIEDACGNALIKVYVSKLYNNVQNVVMVYNSSNQLMMNTAGMKANANGQSVLMQVPNSNTQYYLFTVGTDKKAYYHVIDVSQNKVISKNNLVDNTAGYGQTMALIEDVAGDGNSTLYLRRYASGTSYIMGTAVTSSGVGTPAALTSFTSGDVNGTGELQVSPLGTQMIVADNLGTKNLFGMYNTGGELRRYTISTDHTTLTAGTTASLGANTAARSIAYTSLGSNIYVNVLKVINSTVKRYASSLSSNTTIGTGPTGDIRRGTDNNMYVAWVNGTQLTEVTNPDGTVSTSNVSIGTSGKLTGGMPVQRHRVDHGLSCPAPIYTRTLGKKQYELNDHLGNVRTVISDIKNSVLTLGVPGDYTADVKAYYNYYAFGMEQVGRTYQGVNYRYGFNGMEKDKEIWGGALVFDYRTDDPRLGRFTSIDPLTAKYPWNSPYAFAENKVIQFVELEGLETGTPELEREEKFENQEDLEYDRNTESEEELEERMERAGYKIPKTEEELERSHRDFMRELEREKLEQTPGTPEYEQAQLKRGATRLGWNQLYPPVRHPYSGKLIEQDPSDEAMEVRNRVQYEGVTLYRLSGSTNQVGPNARFWSTIDPREDLEGYLKQTGAYLTLEDAEFVETANLKPNYPFVTRPAEANPTVSNSGGAIEILVPWGGTQNNQIIPLTK
jgi:RHS repeat-associated protein